MSDLSDIATFLLVEAQASMDNWEVFIERASSAITKEIKDEAKAYKLRLAYEELISNIIKAALSNDNKESITLRVSYGILNSESEKIFTLQTEDNGVKFDPGYDQKSKVDVDQEISEREIGGLGIFLIIKSVDKAGYEWVDGFNRNHLWMQLE